MLGDGILTEEVRDVAPPPTLLEGMVAGSSTQPSEVFPQLDPALLQFVSLGAWHLAGGRALAGHTVIEAPDGMQL